MSYACPTSRQRLERTIPTNGQLQSYFAHRRQREVEESQAMAGRGGGHSSGQRNPSIGVNRHRPEDTLIPMSRMCLERHFWSPQGMPSKHIKGAGSPDWVDQGDMLVYFDQVMGANGRMEGRMLGGV